MDPKIISTTINSTQAVAQQRAQIPLPTNVQQGAKQDIGTNNSAARQVEQNKPTEPQQLQTAEQVDELVDRLNSQALTSNHTLRFSIDEKLGKAIISVVDRETDEVIRQIPPETALQIAEAFEEVTAGNLLTESA